MSISSVGIQTNYLQSLRAQNAFQKTAQNKQEIEKTPQGFDKEDVVVSISSKNININLNTPVNNDNSEMNLPKENKYVSEIRQFASQNNITDFEEDDIQDALKYGTSLFVDRMA